MNYRMPALQSPLAQSNQSGQVSDPVSQIIKLIAPIVKHITTPNNPNMGTPMGAAMGGAQMMAGNARGNLATPDLMQANQALGPAKANYASAQSASDTGLQDYLTALQAPRAAMPQQKPAMGANESMGAGIAAALAAALGVRPQFLQQGIQGYTGAREQNAQMNYANETNAYNSANDQRDRELQAKQIGVNDLSRKEQLAFQLMQQAGGDVEKAMDLYRQYNEQARTRTQNLSDKKDLDKSQTQNDIARGLANKVKDTTSANTAIQALRGAGMLTPELEQSLRADGEAGDQELKQKGIQAAYKVKINNVADAKRAAGMMGAKPGSPEYQGFIEIGTTAEQFYAKYHMTDQEKKEFWKFQNEARNAQAFEMLWDRQAFDQWKVNQQNMRQDKSIAAGQAGREYTQGEITKRSREGDQRKVLKPYNDALGKMGFGPLQPVLPGNLPPAGTPAVTPTRRDTGKTVQKPKQATTTPKLQTGPKKVVKTEGGKKVTTFKY